jgi:ankyrin repeat protein
VRRLLLDRKAGSDAFAKMKKAKDLWTAVESGNVAAVRKLLADGTDPNVGYLGKTTILQTAVRNGHQHIAKELLDAGADINADSEVALHEAVRIGDRDLLEFLISRGSRLDAVNYPLLISAAYQPDMIRYLLNKGVDPHAVNEAGETALLWAAGGRSLEGVKTLVDVGVEINRQSESGETALIRAAGSAAISSIDIVEYLVGAGAEVNVATINGTTPLYAAARHGQSSIVKFLLAEGAEVNQAGSFGSALGAATKMAMYPLETVVILLDAGADPSLARENDETPIYDAAFKDSEPLLTLIRYGANVNAASASGETPLHAAANIGSLTNVAALIEAGGDVNARASDGRTPLMMAVLGNQEATAAMLLDSGARIETRDENGKQAVDYAKPDSKLIGLLKKKFNEEVKQGIPNGR